MNSFPSHDFRISHSTVFRYPQPVIRSITSLHLQPREDSNQELLTFDLEFDPPAMPVQFTDQFGNIGHICSIVTPHQELLVRSNLKVRISGQGAIPEHLDAHAWIQIEKMADPVQLWDYLAPSRFVHSSPKLDEFVEHHGIARKDDPLSSLLEASRAIYHLFDYEPGATTADSPIEQILTTRRGVCQDYSHVLLSIGRMWGIPSRYVSGYLHLEGVAGEQALIGASHAWTEFLLPEFGWVGIDPTNDTVADHRHIKVAVGRDYCDVPPTKGVEYGSACAEPYVQVVVSDT